MLCQRGGGVNRLSNSAGSNRNIGHFMAFVCFCRSVILKTSFNDRYIDLITSFNEPKWLEMELLQSQAANPPLTSSWAALQSKNVAGRSPWTRGKDGTCRPWTCHVHLPKMLISCHVISFFVIFVASSPFPFVRHVLVASAKDESTGSSLQSPRHPSPDL